MRAIKYTSRFKRDYRRERSGVLGKKLETLLMEVVKLLAADEALPRRHADRLPDADNLELVRLGSHSELGL